MNAKQARIEQIQALLEHLTNKIGKNYWEQQEINDYIVDLYTELKLLRRFQQ